MKEPTRESKAEMKDFKIGDKVYSPFLGFGTIVSTTEMDPYPIRVKWRDGGISRSSVFTEQGHFYATEPNSAKDILLVPSKEEKDMEVSKSEEESQNAFAVGDRVEHVWHGEGVITEVYENSFTPVRIRFDNGRMGYYSPAYIRKITSSDAKDNNLCKSIDIEPAPDEKTDAVNPSHYQVAGIPGAIEIMEHLMTKEQLEGFLWGNIIKYVYRYGRKGDKKETAGKIAWYAKKLGEVMKEGGLI